MVSFRRHARDWRTYIASRGLVLGILAALLQRKQPYTSQNGQESPGRNHNPTKPKPPSYARRHYAHPSEEEHRTQEQFVWRYTVALNVGIAAVAVLTLIAAFGTYVQTRRQAVIAQESYLASTRPWVFITKRIDNTGVVFSRNGIPNVAIIVSVNTIGQTPAFFVVALAKILPNEDATTLLEQRKICAELKEFLSTNKPRNNPRFPEQTFFPNQPDQKLAIAGTGDSTAFSNLLKSGKTLIAPVIVGCIGYVDAIGSAHNTGFIFDIKQRDASNIGFVQIDISKGDIPAIRTAIILNDLGSGLAD